MHPALLIRGGTVVNADREFKTDVLCVDGRVLVLCVCGVCLLAGVLVGVARAGSSTLCGVG